MKTIDEIISDLLKIRNEDSNCSLAFAHRLDDVIYDLRLFKSCQDMRPAVRSLRKGTETGSAPEILAAAEKLQSPCGTFASGLIADMILKIDTRRRGSDEVIVCFGKDLLSELETIAQF